MKLLNGKQLAAAMSVPRMFVTAMRAEGYQFQYGHQTTLRHALAWRELRPKFRYSDYMESKRRKPRPPRQRRPRKICRPKAIAVEINTGKRSSHYTVDEAALYLRLSTKTIYSLIQRGVLRASTVTRKKMIPSEDVEKLVVSTC
jgi:excisionase family DNA binding protein